MLKIDDALSIEDSMQEARKLMDITLNNEKFMSIKYKYHMKKYKYLNELEETIFNHKIINTFFVAEQYTKPSLLVSRETRLTIEANRYYSSNEVSKYKSSVSDNFKEYRKPFNTNSSFINKVVKPTKLEKPKYFYPRQPETTYYEMRNNFVDSTDFTRKGMFKLFTNESKIDKIYNDTGQLVVGYIQPNFESFIGFDSDAFSKRSVDAWKEDIKNKQIPDLYNMDSVVLASSLFVIMCHFHKDIVTSDYKRYIHSLRDGNIFRYIAYSINHNYLNDEFKNGMDGYLFDVDDVKRIKNKRQDEVSFNFLEELKDESNKYSMYENLEIKFNNSDIDDNYNYNQQLRSLDVYKYLLEDTDLMEDYITRYKKITDEIDNMDPLVLLFKQKESNLDFKLNNTDFNAGYELTDFEYVDEIISNIFSSIDENNFDDFRPISEYIAPKINKVIQEYLDGYEIDVDELTNLFETVGLNLENDFSRNTKSFKIKDYIIGTERYDDVFRYFRQLRKTDNFSINILIMFSSISRLFSNINSVSYGARVIKMTISLSDRDNYKHFINLITNIYSISNRKYSHKENPFFELFEKMFSGKYNDGVQPILFICKGITGTCDMIKIIEDTCELYGITEVDEYTKEFKRIEKRINYKHGLL